MAGASEGSHRPHQGTREQQTGAYNIAEMTRLADSSIFTAAMGHSIFLQIKLGEMKSVDLNLDKSLRLRMLCKVAGPSRLRTTQAGSAWLLEIH